jgi:methionyl aminopeptidase
MVFLKSRHEIELMRKSGRLARRILMEMGKLAREGLTTQDLDRFARRRAKEAEATCAFLGYRGYPAAICTALNEIVVHGIPNATPLKQGDILGIDFATILNGYVGDTAWTFAIGDISPEKQHVMRVTEQALYEGIKQAKPGNRMGDVSHAIQRHVESHGCSVVRALVGHAVGRKLHEQPWVPNYGELGQGPKLKVGMTLAIEPMVIYGTDHEVFQLEDGWTIIPRSGQPSAHFEHTVAVLSDGPDILTEG